MTDAKNDILSKEISGALSRAELAFHLAWSDTRARYRRSILGPFWLVFGTLLGVGGLGFVWGALLDVDRSVFIPSLTISIITWYLLSGSITEAASVFFNNRSLFLNMEVSSLLISLLLLFRQLINFAHNIVVVVIVYVVYPEHLGWAALLAPIGILLVSFNLLWIIQLTGYIGARFRDLAPLIAAIMQPLFFITPVLFRPEQLGARAYVTAINPLTYMLEIVRDPLMGKIPSITTWAVMIGLTIIGWGATLVLTKSKRRRLPYWVN
ncbi:ABC transporter permease [Rhizobium sp. L1K21]|uniref:ABC transporter permease n=1 Tax=Rhizobium sp. L1K21 TaxID=2954933 RepID=UPI002093B414|nr:ABC transporter permease [Rhizobium sp. L1K21]MCO6187959.1 ABC transporter permease [Rhizobium sp. L1K21]